MTQIQQDFNGTMVMAGLILALVVIAWMAASD